MLLVIFFYKISVIQKIYKREKEKDMQKTIVIRKKTGLSLMVYSLIYLMLISLNAKIGFMLDGLVYGTVIWGILNLLKVV